jgi:hypothetical protein
LYVFCIGHTLTGKIIILIAGQLHEREGFAGGKQLIDKKFTWTLN